MNKSKNTRINILSSVLTNQDSLPFLEVCCILLPIHGKKLNTLSNLPILGSLRDSTCALLLQKISTKTEVYSSNLTIPSNRDGSTNEFWNVCIKWSIGQFRTFTARWFHIFSEFNFYIISCEVSDQFYS